MSPVLARYVSHPLVKKGTVEVRAYQQALVDTALQKGSTLVVTPTALGKTVVALLVTVRVLEEATDQVLFLAPTKPLAQQHQQRFRAWLNLAPEAVALLTGAVPPEKRAALWKKARVVCATPQTIDHDLASKRISLRHVRACIFDEAHRAVKGYAYVAIAKWYRRQALRPLVLALTASPGHERKRIQEVCANLEVENIEIRDRGDRDVQPYVAPVAVEWERVTLPLPFQDAAGVLRAFIGGHLEDLKKMGVVHTASPAFYTHKRLLEVQQRVSAQISRRVKKQPSLYAAASKVAALIKAAHALTLLETQGSGPLLDYLDRLKTRKASRADALLFNDPRIQRVHALARRLSREGIEHPKLERLKQLLQKQFQANPSSRVIVFNHYRDSVRRLHAALSRVPGVSCAVFVGQASRESLKGMTQREQAATVSAFEEGAYNTLVATSVAEEGLDIPSCDLVVFYEPVPSEIRTIQRSGRTGRRGPGRVVILMAQGTRDEAYHWVAKNKEEAMRRAIQRLKKTGPEKGAHQKTLHAYREAEAACTVYADQRERASGVPAELEREGLVVVEKQLEVGDYVLSDEVAVERKTATDFLDSLVDGRLFNQLMNLVTAYRDPVLVLEGDPEALFTTRNLHPNAVYGALLSIGLKYRVPVFFTSDAFQTARLLALLARRVQEGGRPSFRLRVGRPGLSLAEQQRFVAESLPGVGPALAGNLLRHFGSLHALCNASERELAAVEKMGPKKARAIHRLLRARYRAEEQGTALQER